MSYSSSTRATNYQLWWKVWHEVILFLEETIASFIRMISLISLVDLGKSILKEGKYSVYIIPTRTILSLWVLKVYFTYRKLKIWISPSNLTHPSANEKHCLLFHFNVASLKWKSKQCLSLADEWVRLEGVIQILSLR